MPLRRIAFLLATLCALFATACAPCRKAAGWRPGDAIVCPHCGKEFLLPEKLGP